jgi:hypothetical protein
MTIAEGRVSTERLRTQGADTVLTGTAAQLYLGLWNRGDEIVATGRDGFVERWHEVQRIRWR